MSASTVTDRIVGRTPKWDCDESQRICGPEATLEVLLGCKAALGITRVADVTGLDCLGIPTVMVVRPAARNLSVTQGKGTSVAAAKVSGLMEAAEHFLAERVALPLRWGSYRDLIGAHRLADPLLLPQYDRPFTTGAPCLWVEGEGIESGTGVWVPYELVHLDYRLPLPAGSGQFLSSSNGLASGNVRVEAVVHGLYEVIERDATTLFYARDAWDQAQRVVDLDTVDDPTCRALLRCFERADVRVTVWETTSDLSVASFLADARAERSDPLRPLGASRGMGTHARRDVALRRALTEAAQSRLTSIAGSRDDIAPADLATARAEAVQAARLSARPVRDFRAVPDARFEVFEDELRWVLARMRALRLPEPIFVDLSSPRFPFHVVRVIAPGLEGISEISGYQPGARIRALRALQVPEPRREAGP